MSFEDYHSMCSETYINLDASDWHESHFLMLNDPHENPGRYSWCGSACSRHTLQLHSAVEQTVYLTAHTWDDRCMADSCVDSWGSQDGSNETEHSIKIPSDVYVRTWMYGANQLKPFKMGAGETIDVTLEMNFTDSRKSKDWSLIAQAPEGCLLYTSPSPRDS